MEIASIIGASFVSETPNLSIYIWRIFFSSPARTPSDMAISHRTASVARLLLFIKSFCYQINNPGEGVFFHDLHRSINGFPVTADNFGKVIEFSFIDRAISRNYSNGRDNQR